MTSKVVHLRLEEAELGKTHHICNKTAIDNVENSKGFQAMQKASRIAEQYGISDMTLAEINAEIYEARK